MATPLKSTRTPNQASKRRLEDGAGSGEPPPKQRIVGDGRVLVILCCVLAMLAAGTRVGLNSGTLATHSTPHIFTHMMHYVAQGQHAVPIPVSSKSETTSVSEIPRNNHDNPNANLFGDVTHTTNPSATEANPKRSVHFEFDKTKPRPSPKPRNGFSFQTKPAKDDKDDGKESEEISKFVPKRIDIDLNALSKKDDQGDSPMEDVVNGVAERSLNMTHEGFDTINAREVLQLTRIVNGMIKDIDLALITASSSHENTTEFEICRKNALKKYVQIVKQLPRKFIELFDKTPESCSDFLEQFFNAINAWIAEAKKTEAFMGDEAKSESLPRITGKALMQGPLFGSKRYILWRLSLSELEYVGKARRAYSIEQLVQQFDASSDPQLHWEVIDSETQTIGEYNLRRNRVVIPETPAEEPSDEGNLLKKLAKQKKMEFSKKKEKQKQRTMKEEMQKIEELLRMKNAALCGLPQRTPRRRKIQTATAPVIKDPYNKADETATEEDEYSIDTSPLMDVEIKQKDKRVVDVNWTEFPKFSIQFGDLIKDRDSMPLQIPAARISPQETVQLFQSELPLLLRGTGAIFGTPFSVTLDTNEDGTMDASIAPLQHSETNQMVSFVMKQMDEVTAHGLQEILIFLAQNKKNVDFIRHFVQSMGTGMAFLYQKKPDNYEVDFIESAETQIRTKMFYLTHEVADVFLSNLVVTLRLPFELNAMNSLTWEVNEDGQQVLVWNEERIPTYYDKKYLVRPNRTVSRFIAGFITTTSLAMTPRFFGQQFRQYVVRMKHMEEMSKFAAAINADTDSLPGFGINGIILLMIAPPAYEFDKMDAFKLKKSSSPRKIGSYTDNIYYTFGIHPGSKFYLFHCEDYPIEMEFEKRLVLRSKKRGERNFETNNREQKMFMSLDLQPMKKLTVDAPVKMSFRIKYTQRMNDCGDVAKPIVLLAMGRWMSVEHDWRKDRVVHIPGPATFTFTSPDPQFETNERRK